MGVRILVVDDLPINLQLVADILEFRGHRIDTASSVSEGRQRLKQAMPDLVLLDLEMPGEGGEVLLREIRQDPALRHIPVVAVTANADERDAVRLQELGFDSYVTKPIDTRAFGAAVERFIASRA